MVSPKVGGLLVGYKKPVRQFIIKPLISDLLFQFLPLVVCGTNL